MPTIGVRLKPDFAKHIKRIVDDEGLCIVTHLGFVDCFDYREMTASQIRSHIEALIACEPVERLEEWPRTAEDAIAEFCRTNGYSYRFNPEARTYEFSSLPQQQRPLTPR